MNRRNAMLGFTLVELLITIVIIAILASIAIPSYRNYLLRSHRTDATLALMRLQAAEEKYYLQYNTYTADLVNGAPTGIGTGATSESSFYSLNVVLDNGGQGYTATATPTTTGGQNKDDKCTTLSITHTGTKNATGSVTNPRETCWR